MYCGNCGTENDDAYSFCLKCGGKLVKMTNSENMGVTKNENDMPRSTKKRMVDIEMEWNSESKISKRQERLMINRKILPNFFTRSDQALTIFYLISVFGAFWCLFINGVPYPRNNEFFVVVGGSAFAALFSAFIEMYTRNYSIINHETIIVSIPILLSCLLSFFAIKRLVVPSYIFTILMGIFYILGIEYFWGHLIGLVVYLVGSIGIISNGKRVNKQHWGKTLYTLDGKEYFLGRCVFKKYEAIHNRFTVIQVILLFLSVLAFSCSINNFVYETNTAGVIALIQGILFFTSVFFFSWNRRTKRSHLIGTILLFIAFSLYVAYFEWHDNVYTLLFEELERISRYLKN